MRAGNIKVNHISKPIGINTENILISWIPIEGIQQNAFRIKLTSNSVLIFDSGKVVTDKTSFSPNMDIPSKTRIDLSVSLWDESDTEGEISFSYFETGINNEDWVAQWIDPEPLDRIVFNSVLEPPNAASYLRKKFFIEDKSSVRMYITAHGIYDAYINGDRVEGFVLAPGTDNYDISLPVQTYDISSLVVEGENELLVSIGDGWWRGCLGWGMQRNRYGSDVALLCQIESCGKVVLATDETWEASQNGPLGLNDMMRIEQYDARKDITDWHGVTVKDFGYDNLSVTDHLPVKEHERFPATLIITPKGEKILDFGQNFAGYVELDLYAQGGETITLMHTEALDEDGNFQNINYQNEDLPYCDQKVEYTCKKGRNVYHQTKCYYGFRYVKIETCLDITGTEFTGIAVYSDMETTASFTCGNNDVNQLFKNTVWSMKSNYVDVPTDCPHREKAGFSGDCQVFSGTAMYLMDSYPVLSRWLRMQMASQLDNGCVRQVVPVGVAEDGFNGAAGWCDSFEVLPYNIMKLYGANELISDLYPAIKKWMQFCINRAKPFRPENADMPEIYRDYFVDTARHWGEWCEPGRGPQDYFKEWDETGHAEFATAYLSYGCKLVAEIAERLGFVEDSEYFKDVSDKAKNSYRFKYLKSGKIESDRQCHYVRPIFMGLLDDFEKQQASKDLVALIKKQGGRIGTGFLTTFELCNVLTDNGYSNIAYDILLNTECPSWLYEVKKGATTLWESWFGIRDGHKPFGSLNHYSFGSVSGWLMSRVLGIVVAEGFATIRPYPDKRLGFASGTYLSPYGKIFSSWRYEENSVLFEIEIPANMQAKILLPNGDRT